MDRSLPFPSSPSLVSLLDSARTLRTRTAVSATAFSAALLHAMTAVALQAQAVAGAGDDAIPLPKGGYRYLVSGLWHDYRSVFDPTGGGRRDLYGQWNTPNVGVALIPSLSAAQAGIRALTGQPTFQLSLGPLEAAGEVRQSTAPLGLDYGVTSRLSVRVVLPYAESRDITQLILNRDGTGANVGLNPAFGTTGAQARASSSALLRQLDAAQAGLNAEVARCLVATAANCTAVRANPAGAQGLLTRAQSTRAALVAVYGDGQRGGSPVVPLTTSPLHASVVATISGLRSDFAAFGVTGIAVGAAPPGASTVMGPAGIRRIATDTAFGIGYEEIGNTRRAGIGDIDVSATYLLLNTIGGTQTARLLTPSRGVRSSLTMGWRFGTAGADRTEDAFDVPIGEGVNTLLFRSTTDVLVSRHFWFSATVRGAQPLEDRIAALAPYDAPPDALFVPLRVSSASRQLGRRTEFELAPRLALGQFFGLSGGYLLRHWGADRFAFAADSTLPQAQTVNTSGRALHAAAVGVTFSTLASYVRGRSRFPAEVIYTHTLPLSASDGVVPAVSSDRLELRVYTGFPRR